MDATLLERTTALLSRVAREDSCIHCSGFAMDALNRLCERLAAAADAEAAAAKVTAERDRLLSDPTLMPCVNWETVSRGCNGDGWQRLVPMAAEADARHEAAAAAE